MQCGAYTRSHTASICQKTRIVDENEIASFQQCTQMFYIKYVNQWVWEHKEVLGVGGSERMCGSLCEWVRQTYECTMHCISAQWHRRFGPIHCFNGWRCLCFSASNRVWNIMVNWHSFGFSSSVAAFLLRTSTTLTLVWVCARVCLYVWCHYHHFAYYMHVLVLNTTLCMMHFCWCNFAMVARCAHKPENPNKGKQAKQAANQPTNQLNQL